MYSKYFDKQKINGAKIIHTDTKTLNNKGQVHTAYYTQDIKRGIISSSSLYKKAQRYLLQQ